jgi:hypothetical protein
LALLAVSKHATQEAEVTQVSTVIPSLHQIACVRLRNVLHRDRRELGSLERKGRSLTGDGSPWRHTHTHTHNHSIES